MYDIIGDIHGHANELRQLLGALGYEFQGDCFRHPQRQVIFVGDFVDRGPQIPEVLEIVRSMHRRGAALAVMGNHEFNALAYHTRDPGNPSEFLRRHSEKNQHQHAATLRQLSAEALADYLEWFRSLPMWLELPGLRVVHACWDPEQIEVMQQALLHYDGVTSEFLRDATTLGTPLFDAIDDVLKGKEVNLPGDAFYLDKDGNRRRKLRVQWYRSATNESYASYALTGDDGLPGELIPQALGAKFQPYPVEERPVFFGHYWMQALRPAPLASNVACVDYSVAKGGMLCAYRWDGEQQLSAEKFFSIPAAAQ